MAIKIALDAGHGLKTAGKQTPDGIKEWNLNDKVRDKVAAILLEYDCELLHTDNDEGGTDESLTSRRKKYVSAGANAFVSIHHNAYTGDWNGATGVEVYTDKNPTAEDTKLANIIFDRLIKYTGLRGRGVKKASFTVINQNTIPAVLCEGGFMDGTEDYKVITSDAGQTAYAKAVAEGIIEFLGLKKKASTSIPKAYTGTFPTLPAKGSLRKGDKGTEVKYLQSFLNWCINAGLEIDGSFGPKTLAAVKAYQKAYGLSVDGKFGPASLAKAKNIKR